MRILDWFRSLLGDASTSVAGGRSAKSPLELPVGAVFAYYRERYVVTGVRVLSADGHVRFDHCAEGESGDRVVVSATEDGALELGRVLTETPDWTTDTHADLGDEPLRKVGSFTGRVRHEGRGTAGPAREVAWRRFEDEAGDRLLLLEEYGEEREARLCEPIFRDELTFGEELEATAGEGPLTAALGAAGSDVDADPDVRRVEKGSPAAAALALTGTGEGRAVEADHDPTAYDDDEWADAEFDDEPAACVEGAGADGIWDSTFPGRGRAVVSLDEDEDDWLDV